MKKLYFIYTDECGEVEGVFDENENLLDLWSNNDANWRHEYFSPFMKKLGFDADPKMSKALEKRLQKKLIAKAEEIWG